MNASPRARRPGGRSARTAEAVAAATLGQLAAVGYERLTIESVAAEAGVHKTTVYRRWRSKPELVASAMLGLVQRDLPIPDTGTLKGDLQALVRAMLGFLADPRSQALVRSLASLADRDDESRHLRQHFWATRAAEFAPVVERAIRRGELPADTDPAELQEALAAPFYLRFLLSGGPLADDADQVLDRVLTGFGARPAGPGLP